MIKNFKQHICIENLFHSLLVTQVLYLIISLFNPSLPGWKMFIETKQINFEVHDEANNKIDTKKYMVNTTYSLSKKQAIGLTTFICKKSQISKLYISFSPKEKYEVQKPLCKARKLRLD